MVSQWSVFTLFSINGFGDGVVVNLRQLYYENIASLVDIPGYKSKMLLYINWFLILKEQRSRIPNRLCYSWVTNYSKVDSKHKVRIITKTENMKSMP